MTSEPNTHTAKKAWGGRFTGQTDPLTEKFTESISYDQRLWREDIEGSIAHAEMLAAVGIITDADCQTIVQGLQAISTEIANGQFQFRLDREDIHMNIEAVLIERIGDAGRKLHTARSRNDQVATAVRLWTRKAARLVDQKLAQLQRALLTQAQLHTNTVIPAYTHLQRAQPVVLAHWLLAFVEKFGRDRERICDTSKRINVMPLGSAAVAGTSLPINRQLTASKLGFDAITRNSMDATSDRDFIVEFVFDLALIGSHLSSLAEDWILWCTTEFGFLRLDDSLCTGSSIMPQKKNPDLLELTRGKSARVVGSLQTLLTLIKGLPMAYNRDLQEDKEPLFDATDTIGACLDVVTRIAETAQFQTVRIEKDIERGFLDATSLMEKLIKLGVPMRSGHEIVGKLVSQAESIGITLAQLPDQMFIDACGKNIDLLAIKSVLGTKQALASFCSEGSTGQDSIKAQIAFWKKNLETID